MYFAKAKKNEFLSPFYLAVCAIVCIFVFRKCEKLGKVFMKRILLPLISLFFCAASSQAQTIIAGDMNEDGALTIVDVSELVDMVAGKSDILRLAVASMDKKLLVGDWKNSKGIVSFAEDGTTTYGRAEGRRYRFLPASNRIVLCENSDEVVDVLDVIELDGDRLVLSRRGTTEYTTYQRYTDNVAHEYVDLGLSVKWATCNIGSEKPEEPGEYYKWSVATGKSSAGTANIAQALWGVGWRLPTVEEIKELMEKCDWSWSDTRRGYLVTSKSDRTKSIFLPLTGRMINGAMQAPGNGYYWSDSSRGETDAHCLYFYSGYKTSNYVNVDNGCVVRPVHP